VYCRRRGRPAAKRFDEDGMSDRTPITDRGVEGRVTGYGDRVVAQGDSASRPPAGTATAPGVPASAPTKAAAQPAIVTVTIYDPKGRLKGKVAAGVIARLVRDLNAITRPGLPADHLLKQLGIRIEIRHLMRMSTSNERFTTGTLDFPIYILNGHTSDATSAKEIRDLMLDHGIKDAGRARGQFNDADAAWKDANIEGMGIQPLEGYKKVGFIKGDNVAKVAKDFEAAFTNVIKHEFGHMCNILGHSGTGVMREGIRLAGGYLDYTDSNRGIILTELATLKTVPAAVLQQRYERANP
jgi:hypothetical protein